METGLIDPVLALATGAGGPAGGSLSLVTVAGASLGALVLLHESRRWLRGLVIGLAILLPATAALALFPWYQRSSGVGIRFLGGADYWVVRAAKTQDDREALKCLRTVVDSSPDGGAIWMRAIDRLRDNETRRRLLRITVTYYAPRLYRDRSIP
jgi:hypothetical protein